MKRSRSCDNHGEQQPKSKKTRLAASDSLLGAGDVIPGEERYLRRDGPRDNHLDSGTKVRREAVDAAELSPAKKVEIDLPETSSTPISSWIQHLPQEPAEFEIMSQASFKRPRSDSDASLELSASDSGNETRRSRGDLYKDPRYDPLVESKGVFMGNSEAGPLPEEIDYCKGLLKSGGATTDDIEFNDPILDGNFLQRYVDLMEQSSELRLCIDLHARLFPSAEILSLQQGKTSDLREGYNDRWLQALEFVSKIPQPDRTVAYRASVFTDAERQKLYFQPGVKSLYSACEGMMFPFLTCEVKAGSEALKTAKRANANSMAIALRGVVDLFRRADLEQDVHRKILGITVAHNASTIELYGHFPEIDGPKTSFYQYRLRTFGYADRDGADRYTCCTFVRNIYTQFAPRHLERLRQAIAKLDFPPPKNDPIDLDAGANFLTPTASDRETLSIRSVLPAGQNLTAKAQNALLTQSVVNLQQSVANLQKELERQRQESQKELERQRQESQKELERQRKESHEREAEAKEREAVFMKLLSERSDSPRNRV